MQPSFLRGFVDILPSDRNTNVLLSQSCAMTRTFSSSNEFLCIITKKAFSAAALRVDAMDALGLVSDAVLTILRRIKILTLPS